ncbi:hypothetical protein XAC3810_660167 [Xanthomonas citri pv. citri]|uniref:Uncharacterized protein n=1 Tax=Xanthomonas citri pv. citri TaxID=611301 RepID=A0A0U5BX20_XANCI|nr:hypothetical protein XAC9322_630139 [Xanthomonas citri pv. citri]CEE36511.1 hypothetical protein XAC3824_820190 [Xanthomonas citri pv. citri]CEE37537.1 hypothetical protein XAC1083_650166 [Xanthomonas citri pv. citri]CEE46077.1 hypothetical protein XAC3810_660167 [Xanthomonas citri pv. citri]CEE47142.1 hypothetical protein XAC902_970168 [Xanthomonas citri pv. citri]
MASGFCGAVDMRRAGCRREAWHGSGNMTGGHACIGNDVKGASRSGQHTLAQAAVASQLESPNERHIPRLPHPPIHRLALAGAA